MPIRRTRFSFAPEAVMLICDGVVIASHPPSKAARSVLVLHKGALCLPEVRWLTARSDGKGSLRHRTRLYDVAGGSMRKLQNLGRQ